MILVHACLAVDGWHRWPDAPERQAFLRVLHRHQFHITGTSEAKHANRQVECFDIADAMRLALERWRTVDGSYDFGDKSCETIATYLVNSLHLYSCEVREDGLQGATVYAAGSIRP
jgi:hypothetical protein